MTDELEQMSLNQRRALDKSLSALETFAAIWAAEIRLGAMSARIAAVPNEAERAKRIEAMIEQGFIEGAYRHYLDHKDKCDEIEAARDAAEQSRDSVEVAEIAENFSLKWIASPDDFPIGTKFYAGLPTEAEDAARWRYLASHIEDMRDSAEVSIGRIAVLYRLDKYVLADIENGEVLAANIDAAIESQRSEGKSS